MMNLFSPNLPPFSAKVAFFYSWLDLIWNSNSVEVKLLLLLLSYLYEFETRQFRFNLFFLSETNIFPTMKQVNTKKDEKFFPQTRLKNYPL